MRSLPASPRILVIGTSSAGKSTLAASLSGLLGIPWIELDELYWSAGWRPKAPEDFLELVRQAVAGETWVADGNYSTVRPAVFARANVIVWLNYPLPLVFWRGLMRAVRRSWTGQVLWHGNRESFRQVFFSRDSILLWILTTHRKRAREFRALQQDARAAGIRWIEFRRPSEATAWVQKLREVAHASSSG
jgi:adenylate kinase family enzyme